MDREPIETQAYAQHLLREHRRLHKMLRHVEESWPASDSARRDAVLIARLLSAVEELRQEMGKHFAEEESGGVLEEAVARAPDLGREQSRLEEEHPSLLWELDEIAAEIRAAADRGTLADRIREQFEQFTRRALAHEAAENRILAQGFRIEVD